MFWNVTFIYNAFVRTTDHCKVQTAFASRVVKNYTGSLVPYTRAFNEFFYEFLRIFLISENSLKFATFCWGNEFSIYAKKRHQKCAIWAPSHNFVGRYLRNKGMYRQSENNLLNSNISSTCPDNMVNFSLLDLLASLGHPCKFQRVSRLGSVTLLTASAKLCRAAITLGIGPHF